ncbi:proteoglycan 4-like [Ostrinia nubilalis]|uniref:proteoglycan 4-like n=1 Tax=Ostrinia nubilalis TaxID=29057 RepID=UPI003082361B
MPTLGSHEAAATLLAKRALPLFPNGFVRMPTLLRQAPKPTLGSQTHPKPTLGSHAHTKPTLGSHAHPKPTLGSQAHARLPRSPLMPTLGSHEAAATLLAKRALPLFPNGFVRMPTLLRQAPKPTLGSHEAAATLLAKRALPLFPNGFVRMPTLLRQADLSKDIKASDVKRQRLGSASQPAPPAPPAFVEPIHFPSSLTVTTTTNPPAPAAPPKEEDKYKPNSVLGTFFNLNKDLIVERPEDRKNDRVKDDVYVPPNNIGSITITPVIPAQKDKKPVVPDKPKEGLIRVKSPAALNEMVKKEKAKKPEKTNHVKEKRMDTPLHIDTNLQPSKKDPSPKKDEISPKQIETMRITENNIPRPALVPVRHSPTFAKPDKRPPEVKKKKDVVIVSDVDPLGDVQAEPFAVDDSSSDVELVEDSKNTDKSEPKIGDNKSDTVPSKDKVSDSKKVNSVKHKERSSKETKEKRSDSLDETTKEIDNVMREIREMQNSQEPTKLNSTSYAGVITSARHEKSSNAPPFAPRPSIFGETRSDKDKFAERTSLNKMDGCSAITG